jgi:hypothetical protein
VKWLRQEHWRSRRRRKDIFKWLFNKSKICSGLDRVSCEHGNTSLSLAHWSVCPCSTYPTFSLSALSCSLCICRFPSESLILFLSPSFCLSLYLDLSIFIFSVCASSRLSLSLSVFLSLAVCLSVFSFLSILYTFLPVFFYLLVAFILLASSLSFLCIYVSFSHATLTALTNQLLAKVRARNRL